MSVIMVIMVFGIHGIIGMDMFMVWYDIQNLKFIILYLSLNIYIVVYCKYLL